MSRRELRIGPGRRLAAGVAIAALAWLVHAPASAVGFTVGAGSSFGLGSATFDLGCGDLVVAGTFGVGSGTVEQALDVTIDPGGTLNGETGTLEVTGDWVEDDAGSEATLNLQGTATVDFVDVQDIHAIPNPFTLGPNSVVGSNTASLSLCGDIDGNFLIETADVTQARQHLMGQAIAGEIRRCNVVGLFDPLEAGEDCDVADIYTLTRLVAGENVLTDANACKP